MDIKAVGNLRMHSPLRRTIGCLLLVVFWYVDGATGGELPWRVNNGSTDVRSVVVTKDVLIFNHKEQGASMRRAGQHLSNYPLICGSHCLSFLLRPICRQWSSIVLSASHDDIVYGVSQRGIISEDNISVIQNITTFTWAYRPRKSIVLGMVTDSGVGPYSHEGNGWIAINGPRSEPQTINNRADIGAELPMLGIERRISLIPSGIGEPISRLDGVLGVNAGLSHLNQLISDKKITPYGSTTQCNGSDCQNSSPDDQRPRFPFVGLCLIIVGSTCAASGVVVLCGNRRRAVFAGAGLLIVATLIVFHGIGLLLLPFNEWPIP
jgi:hypothetical protein